MRLQSPRLDNCKASMHKVHCCILHHAPRKEGDRGHFGDLVIGGLTKLTFGADDIEIGVNSKATWNIGIEQDPAEQINCAIPIRPVDTDDGANEVHDLWLVLA